jgi:hypothetical protein
MTREKRIYAILAALWVAAAVCVGATVRSFHRGVGIPADVTHRSAYVLRANDDYVAVYEADAPGVPVEITDIPVRELREHDKKLMRAGLGAEDREALLMLLEDLKA